MSERSSQTPPGILRFGVFEAQMHERRLLRAGKIVPIQDQPFRLLVLLLEKPGEIVTREEMREAIWPDGTTVDFERGMNTAVNKLRAAIGDSASSPRFIETVPRRGYRFVSPVEFVLEPNLSESPSQRAAPGFRQRSLVIALLSIVAAIAVFAIGSRWVASRTVEDIERKVSLAVLPFVNLSGDAQQEYLSSGLTEEMTSRLGRLAPNHLAVIARTTMMTYLGKRQPISQISLDLEVDYFLEGSIRRSGARARINAQLIRASDQTQLWSEDYDSTLEDILTVQADVAQRIAKSLAVEVLPKAQRTRSVDPLAYEAYLRGLHFRDMLTKEGYGKAIHSFERAVSYDPDFAPAYAAMSACYCLLAGHGLEVSEPSLLMPQTQKYASRALELDGTLSDAQGALGMAYFKHEWDWSRAEVALRRATEMNPSDPMARIWYSFYLASQGRHEDALSQVDEAKRADPFSRVANTNWAWQRYEARRYDDAVSAFDEVLELFPDLWVAHWGRGLSRLERGSVDGALADLRRAVELSDGNASALGALGIVHARSGDGEMARQILEELLARSQEQYVPPVLFVALYGALGDVESAFESLERAHHQRSRSLAWILVGHEFDPLRGDPRFSAMLKRMQLDF